ncbi:MAG: cysteine-rich CWC family protein [Acidobacteria bacterium]|nr:cysteine-rich CWC family protein [Acidobacteriota bacterium]MCA1637748.1 cysteine-rich CWC family protein [Acidobacteriota bacterium]
MNKKITYEKLVCESCGKEFSCGAKVEKCWCFAIELKVESMAELKENFKRCLCKNCLEDFAKAV